MRTRGVLSAACLVLGAIRRRMGGTQHSALSTQHSTTSGQRATGNLIAIALCLIALAPDAFACSVCYGAPGDPLVKGANNGILFLLAVVGFVQLGFAAMFWSFWRRGRAQRRFRESLRVIEGGPIS